VSPLLPVVVFDGGLLSFLPCRQAMAADLK
jgi:hypothetical protein